jgi:CDP-diacylglycerol--glycerol-3-phosphate 3-phosphatidyltransferase
VRVESGSVAPSAPLWNVANIVTMLRIALVPVFAWLHVMDSTASQAAAAAVFVIAALTDRLDGYLARSRGLVTDFGKIADPIADKALTMTALVLLSIDGTVPWWVTIVIVVRELGVTLLRFVMVRRGAVMPASSGGKLKTVLQLVFIAMLLVPWDAFLPANLAWVVDMAARLVMVAAVIVTLVTGVDYTRRAWRIDRTSPGGRRGR